MPRGAVPDARKTPATAATAATAVSVAWWVVGVCVGVRVVQSLAVITAFNPDEYWQSLEVAHARAFGYGYVTWEWQPDAQIRGYAQVLLLDAWYRVLALCGADTRWAVAFTPRIWQGLLAAAGDVATYVLAQRWFGRRAANWTLFCTLICWFMGYCVVRTFTNSLECVFTACALAFWPFPQLPLSLPFDADATVPAAADEDAPTAERRADPYARSAVALTFVAVSVVFRPTAAAIWLPLGVHYLWSEFTTSAYTHPPLIAPCLRLAQCVAFAVAAVAVSVAVDWIGYGTLTLSALNFLRVNALGGGAIAKLYGTHPWHWYVTSGWPTLLSALLPVFGYALYRLMRARYTVLQRRAAVTAAATAQPHGRPSDFAWSRVWDACVRQRALALWWQVIAWGLFVYSFNAHKEFRFVLPLLPPALVYCGFALATIEARTQRQPSDAARDGGGDERTAAAATVTPTTTADRTTTRFRGHAPAPATAAAAAAAVSESASPVAPDGGVGCWRNGRALRLIVAGLVVSNAGAFAYLARWHQAGPISAVNFLADRIARLPDPRGISVDFLMDCHNTPFYAYFHFPAPFPRPALRTLECAPLLHPLSASEAADAEAWNPHRNTSSTAYRFKADAARFVSEFYAPPSPSPSPSSSPASAHAPAAGSAAGSAAASAASVAADVRFSGSEPMPSYVVAYRDARLPALERALLTPGGLYRLVGEFYHAPADETHVLVYARADRPDL